MHLERYEFKIFENRYTFYSEGPKGKIQKDILYQIVKGGNTPLYNLTFGDWNDKAQRIDDQIISNNGDRQKILATIAASIIHFMEVNPDSFILAKGSTPSRTRLYQMNIASYLAVITAYFEIEGFIYNKWELFQAGHNYKAFLLRRKKT
jgi:hypothetical protein